MERLVLLPALLSLVTIATGESSRRVAAVGPESIGIQQSDTTKGEITGLVTDSSDSEIANAEVILDGASFRFHRTTTTNRRGSFGFTGLPVGEVYVITIRRIGYAAERREVTLRAGDTRPLFVVMRRMAQRLPDAEARRGKGRLVGKVVPFGAIRFYSAEVLVTDPSGKLSEKGHVWADGKYRVGEFDFQLSAGTYTVTVRSMGFEKQVLKEVIVEPGEITTVNPILFWTGNIKPDPDGYRPRFRRARLYASTEELKKGPANNVFNLIRRHSVGEPGPNFVGLECGRILKFFINGERVPFEAESNPALAGAAVAPSPPRGGGSARGSADQGLKGGLSELPDNAEPSGILARIPPEDVLEIRFVSCFDDTVPFDQRPSYWLNVKPRKIKYKTRKEERKQEDQPGDSR